MNYKLWLAVACLGVMPVWHSMAVDAPEVSNKQSEVTMVSKQQESIVSQAYTRVGGKISAIHSKNRIAIDDPQGPHIILTRYAKVLDLATGEWVENYAFQEGEEVIAFVRHDTPQTMSMPPQTAAQVIAVHPRSKYSIDMDYYNVKGEGYSRRLVVNRWPATAVDNNGHVVDAKAAGQKIVLYRISTRSLPPQTNPEKVIVWKDSAEEMDQVKQQDDVKQQDNAKQQVDSRSGDSSATTTEITWIPLRDYFAKKGVEITWDNDLRAVVLEKGAQKVCLYVDENKITHQKESVSVQDKIRLAEGTTYIMPEVAEMLAKQLQA